MRWAAVFNPTLLWMLLCLTCGEQDSERARGENRAWEEWASEGLFEATAVAVGWAEHGRDAWLQREVDALADHAVALGAAVTFEYPAFVMNLAHRQDRREHALAVLGALGFSNIIFPETVAAADVDLQALIAQGWLTAESFRQLQSRPHLRPERASRAYVANTVAHLQALRRGLDSGHEIILVFEDDLLPAASLADLQQRLSCLLKIVAEGGRSVQGVDEVDMLYLEYCYEDCQSTLPLREESHQCGIRGDSSGVARAVKPLCSAAIAYSRAGAQRVLDLCVPIFDGIDGMLPALVANGSLSALTASPPAFYQDGFWGTDAGREINAPNLTQNARAEQRQHYVYLSPCQQLEPHDNMSLIRGDSLRGVQDEEYLDEDMTLRVRVQAAGESLLGKANRIIRGLAQDAYFAAGGTTEVSLGLAAHGDLAGVFYTHSCNSSCDEAAADTLHTHVSASACRCRQRASLDPSAFSVPVGAWSHDQFVLHVPPVSACWHRDSSTSVRTSLSICLLRLVWYTHSGLALYEQHVPVHIVGPRRGSASLDS